MQIFIKRSFIYTSVGVSLLALSGCASYALRCIPGSPCQAIPIGSVTFGERHFMRASAPVRPLWVDNIKKYREEHKGNGYRYFVGAASGARSYAAGRDAAYINAMQILSSSVISTVDNLYSSVLSENSSKRDNILRDIKDSTSKAVKGTITGGTVDQYYWTQYWVQSGINTPIQYRRNVYVLVHISAENYKNTIAMTLESAKAKAVTTDAKKLISKVEKIWLNTNK